MESIRKAPLSMSLNQVSIIGKIASEPKFSVLPDGKKVANFSMATHEQVLDRQGNLHVKRNIHRITAFGRWAKVLEELCSKGVHLAVDGKLVSRFYSTTEGERKFFSEIEVNDLVII